MHPDLDASRFTVHHHDGGGFRQAYVREGVGGAPLLLVHGWPETKRIWWRVIEPLAAAGFEVIAPDLRGFGDSAVAPDGFHDTVSSSLDLMGLLAHLGHERAVVVAGDFGAAIAQDLALRAPAVVDRLVVFNGPVPFLPERMTGLRTMSASTHDYFVRQGTDPEGLAAELATPEQRRRYIATFYSSRLWAHPGAFDLETIDFHTEPFADAARLRAGFGAYTSVFDPATRREPVRWGPNDHTRTVILHGASDPVVAPDFDRMAAAVFARHVGPYRVRDCGHFVPWEAPDVLITTVIGFCPDLVG